MLINRLLRDSGYIFIQNVDPLYIKMIIDIGSYPIFTYTHRSHKSIYIGSKLDDYSFLIGEECCNLLCTLINVITLTDMLWRKLYEEY